MLMILARLVRSESFWAIVKVRSPHTGPGIRYIIDKAKLVLREIFSNTNLFCLCCERAGLLGPRVVSPHPQGLQGSHLNLSQTSAQRHTTYFFSKQVLCEGVLL